jgi:hypothetical protein
MAAIIEQPVIAISKGSVEKWKFDKGQVKKSSIGLQPCSWTMSASSSAMGALVSKTMSSLKLITDSTGGCLIVFSISI